MLDHRPDVASLIVGLNDSLCATWDPAKVRADLLHTAGRLGAQGAMLLTVRFDHTRVFGLPRLLAHSMGARIGYQRDLRRDPRRRTADCRSTCRHTPVSTTARFRSSTPHPSELGHRALADQFSALLEQHGLAFQPPALELDGDPTSRLEELRWLATDGVPWLARRATRAARSHSPPADPPALAPCTDPGRIPTLSHQVTLHESTAGSWWSTWGKRDLQGPLMIGQLVSPGHHGPTT